MKCDICNNTVEYNKFGEKKTYQFKIKYRKKLGIFYIPGIYKANLCKTCYAKMQKYILGGNNND